MLSMSNAIYDSKQMWFMLKLIRICCENLTPTESFPAERLIIKSRHKRDGERESERGGS